jgi:hypothetical protein
MKEPAPEPSPFPASQRGFLAQMNRGAWAASGIA